MGAGFLSNRFVQLVAAMVRTGILGYGGGPSVIPLIRYEAVSRYGWMKDEEFGEVLAVANALPGPIATKIAAYLGYREKGWAGAAVATIAHILPSSVAMLLLMSIVQLLSKSAVVAGMIAAVVPVIAVMIGMMAYEFGRRAVKGLGWATGIVASALTFLLLEVVPIHPAIVIALFLAYGAVHFQAAEKLRARLERRKRGKGE
ncbi:chromate transporter [Cohnella sp. REN36]|uniref:chromate transporter n=1 Tax=Cohnella sp. REN36 TaxID=2887347 RepID=UPI001D14D44B|nr:chromate transporter [Cohnella sp. REN36]MCC3372659.1 chromate transporter [Cohnella sp. REN36]